MPVWDGIFDLPGIRRSIAFLTGAAGALPGPLGVQSAAERSAKQKQVISCVFQPIGNHGERLSKKIHSPLGT